MTNKASVRRVAETSEESTVSDTYLNGRVAEKSGNREWRRFFGLREMGVFYALIALVVILSFATAYLDRPNYLSIENFTNVLYQSSLIAIMAVAMTVILITGNFDLSVASVAALSAVILIGLADSLGFWPSLIIALLIAAGAGLLNGLIVQLLGINAFIVTLGTLTAIRGVVLIFTDGRSLAVQEPAVLTSMKAFEAGRIDVGIPLAVIGAALLAVGVLRAKRAGLAPASVGMVLGGVGLFAVAFLSRFGLELRYPIVYMMLFTGVVWAVLNFTIVGRRVYAVGGNPEAARLSGINVFRYKLAAFVLSSVAAGFAGVLFASRLRSINPSALSGAELTVIASAILGGTSLFGGAGSVIKTLAGALLLYSLTNGFNILNLGTNYQGLIEGIVVVSAAAIYTVGSRKSS